ncbi:hypothetical protein [Streptomyces sp. T028]|uniref:hypothetical protein n=1 Tax=Streptomyces sp. T028 TaxID=3394379 RepID=UPI003A8A4660
MRHRIARLFEALLQLLLPGTGCRRRTVIVPVAGACSCPPCSCAEERGLAPRTDSQLLRGEDNATVRPYLVAFINGVEVTA